MIYERMNREQWKEDIQLALDSIELNWKEFDSTISEILHHLFYLLADCEKRITELERGVEK